MLKLIIILLLVIYLVARFAGFFFRVAYWLMGKPNPHTFQKDQKPTAYESFTQNGLKIFIPKSKKGKGKTDKEEFVDYEEVKD